MGGTKLGAVPPLRYRSERGPIRSAAGSPPLRYRSERGPIRSAAGCDLHHSAIRGMCL
jgi:hypothetical protein